MLRTLLHVLRCEDDDAVVVIPAWLDSDFEFSIPAERLIEKGITVEALPGHWFYARVDLQQADPNKIIFEDIQAMDIPRKHSYPGLGS